MKRKYTQEELDKFDPKKNANLKAEIDRWKAEQNNLYLNETPDASPFMQALGRIHWFFTVTLPSDIKYVPRNVGSFVIGRTLYWGSVWGLHLFLALLVVIFSHGDNFFAKEVAGDQADGYNPFLPFYLAGMFQCLAMLASGFTSNFKLYAGNVVFGATSFFFWVYYYNDLSADLSGMIHMGGWAMLITSVFFNGYDVIVMKDAFGGHVLIMNHDVSERFDLFLCTIVGLIMIWIGEYPDHSVEELRAQLLIIEQMSQ
jgi:hypothetical protein